MAFAFIRLPRELEAVPDSVPFGWIAHPTNWSDPTGRDVPWDAVDAFIRSPAEFEAGLSNLQRANRRDGMIWISSPKVPTDVTDPVVRTKALKPHLVVVKVAAVELHGGDAIGDSCRAPVTALRYLSEFNASPLLSLRASLIVRAS